MKITLTQNEAVEMIRQSIQEKSGYSTVDVEIIPNADISGILLNKIGYSIPADKKIEKIKTLRELSSDKNISGTVMGLADAKYAIEHWDTFINFVKIHGRFPYSDCSLYGMK